MLIQGLKRLEYRGYDSAGVVVANNGHLEVRKEAGKIVELEKLLQSDPAEGTYGIGHTRWATHGPPTTRNAHPHVSENGDFALVHNGIIENAGTLRKVLQDRGHVFSSDTDTEVLVHLIEEVYTTADGRAGESLERAVETALSQVEGTYGIAVVSTRDPGKIVVARLGSPLLIGVGENGETFVASDAAAVIAHTRDVIYLDDGDMATITKKGYTVHRPKSGPVSRPVNRVDWDLGEVERGGYDHFMLKEIMEQPSTLRETMRGRLLEDEGSVKLGGLTGMDDELRQAKRVVILGCGTSWHSGLIGEYLLEDIARIPTEVEYASEFRYRRAVVEPETLAIAISQSGETADTLWAMREAKQQGATTLGVVNAVGGTIPRETDAGIYLHAGPEIGVASTKAFTSQVVVLTMMTIHLGRLRGTLSQSRGREIVRALRQLPEQVAEILKMDNEIRALAEQYKDSKNFLYLGRGYNFPAALEGALKLKEISYIHAEGYPAAEMKHGPIALIDENMPVVVIAPRDGVYDKVRSNIDEVKARGGCIIAVVSEDDEELAGVVEHVIRIPRTHDALTPILASIPLQLLAYHIAVLRGANVDQPRNLAKSVTVE
ncbi:glucosamine--fructose-6-phosphate aminotransferase (isomerizing) [Longimicrobium terrae]|uniref:Glutamine--fructose-6-phosphate aminotransferase [isomerizing] n=2 Tax=Longimicrobium terrae TaxID=1639882 RepID=A0A841H336_9BACT|nr:glucosamine--fructose-6-phosphate aminotransferase (isomerizing) [Longimicrobium terrae]MBB6072437.1 glucosamine--fructose-6-phosphate aminotransferase (isomerizing) [Longimicrobium terrae]